MKKLIFILFCVFVLIGISTLAFAADECDYNSDCFSDEKCSGNECVELDCSHNEIIRNHKCVEEYDECDYNSDCFSDERCSNGECRELDCSSNEIIRNHRCEQRYECYYNTDCVYDQKCLNNNCITLFCSADSYIQNHACVKKAVEEPKTELITIYSTAPIYTQPAVQESSFESAIMLFLIIGIIAGFILGLLAAR